MTHDMIERIAEKHGIQAANVYETLFAAIEGDDVEKTAGGVPVSTLAGLLRQLLRYRLSHPRGFDAFALKVLFPQLTHAEIARVMASAFGGRWSHRARSVEALAELFADHPELRNVVAFAQQGGARESYRERRTDPHVSLEELDDFVTSLDDFTEDETDG